VWEGWTLEMARNDSQKFFQLVETAQGLLIFTDSTSSKNSVLGCMHPCRRALSRKIADWCAVKKLSHWQDKRCKESNDNIGSRESTLSINSVGRTCNIVHTSSGAPVGYLCKPIWGSIRCQGKPRLGFMLPPNEPPAMMLRLRELYA
jgi:hypothetical protein